MGPLGGSLTTKRGGNGYTFAPAQTESLAAESNEECGRHENRTVMVFAVTFIDVTEAPICNV